MASSSPRSAPIRIVFLSRDPVLHQQGGSTTYALGLLKLLMAQGAEVTLVATSAFSRSPRLFFRLQVPVPRGLQLRFPGYRQIGHFYVVPFRPKAWARAASRAATRLRWLHAVPAALERLYRGRLFVGGWDLTSPAPGEREIALQEIEAAGATAVLANYCLWGPLLEAERSTGRRTAILMHDLLSARAERFASAGLPQDCPPLIYAEEMQWLSGAEVVLAAQEREAELIRPEVDAEVLVAPIVLQPRQLGEEHVLSGNCLFVGSDIAPNQMGLQFLLRQVWPRVRAEVPGATLAIVGGVGEALRREADPAQLAAQGIAVLGVVPALEEAYARAAVCVVPLLVGTGIKIKLLEALGFGKAVVSTSVGVEGCEAWAQEAIAVTDDPEAFATAVVRLLRDDGFRRRREAATLRLARQHFGPQRPLPPEFTAALLSPKTSPGKPERVGREVQELVGQR